jgi:hypothetical protein
MHAYMVAENFWLPTAEIYEETGWIIKRLEPYENNDVSCYGVEDLARSVMYAMSHCGDYDDRQHYRFFGAISNESASGAQKARMSGICRDYADHVLGLPTSSVTCREDVSDDDSTDSSDADGVEDSEGGDGATNGSEADSDDYQPCGGRLVAAKHIPELLADNDWPDPIEEQLRELYQNVVDPPD